MSTAEEQEILRQRHERKMQLQRERRQRQREARERPGKSGSLKGFVELES